MIEVSDFFDQIFNWMFKKYPRTRCYIPLYHKWKEMMMYGFFGLGTFLIAIISYAALTEGLSWNILIANSLAWVLCTLFAFFTNRRWVFTKHAKGVFAFFIQLGGFCFGRFLTLIIEDWMLFFFVGILQLPNMTVKFCSQFIVIVLNYVFSKLLVFRKTDHEHIDS